MNTITRSALGQLSDLSDRDLLSRARHQSKRKVELIVATLHPRADVPSTIRKLPARHSATVPAPRSEERGDAVAADAAVPVEPLRPRPTPARPQVTPLTPE